jgi:hypothetical protein
MLSTTVIARLTLRQGAVARTVSPSHDSRQPDVGPSALHSACRPILMLTGRLQGPLSKFKLRRSYNCAT